MFGVSLLEVLFILAIALMLFGPKRLPEAAGKLGKLIGTIRKSSDAVRREFYHSMYQSEKELETEAKGIRKLLNEESPESASSKKTNDDD